MLTVWHNEKEIKSKINRYKFIKSVCNLYFGKYFGVTYDGEYLLHYNDERENDIIIDHGCEISFLSTCVPPF